MKLKILKSDKKNYWNQRFKKLKKISYDWKVEAVYLDKNLKNKVEIINPTWQDLNEDERLEYQHHHSQTAYEELIKNKVVLGETE